MNKKAIFVNVNIYFPSAGRKVRSKNRQRTWFKVALVYRVFKKGNKLKYCNNVQKEFLHNS